MRFLQNFLAAALILMIVYPLSGQSFTNYTTTNGLVSDNVSSVAIDANDNLWFGTQNGVSFFDRTNWTTYTNASDSGLVNDDITAVMVASTGNVWIGTSFGTSVFDGANWTAYTTADGLGNNQIKHIAEDQNGHIWFGTIAGASRFDGTAWTNYGTNDGIPFGGVNHIELASNGNLWLSSGLGGAIVYDGNNFTAVTETDGLLNNKVRSIALDASGNKWVGTSDGITVLDGSNQFTENHTRLFILPPPDTLNPVEDVEVDSRGLVWAAVYVDYLVTEGGVSFYDGSTWTDFDVSDGLVGPVVRRLAIDSNDDVWVATSTGVSQISGITVGSAPQLERDDFDLFPMPAHHVLNLRLRERLTDDALPLELYNLEMVRVADWQMSKGTQEKNMTLPELPAGLYFLRIGSQMEKVLLD